MLVYLHRHVAQVDSAQFLNKAFNSISIYYDCIKYNQIVVYRYPNPN